MSKCSFTFAPFKPSAKSKIFSSVGESCWWKKAFEIPPVYRWGVHNNVHTKESKTPAESKNHASEYIEAVVGATGLPNRGAASERRERCAELILSLLHFAEIRFGTFPRIPAGTANSRLPKNFKVKIFYFKIFNAHAAGRAGPKMTGYAGKKQGFIGDVFVR